MTKILKWISQEEAIKRANAKIYEAATTKYTGLKSRWWKLNYRVGGSFRFKNIITIAGASGHGKSFILNMLRSDFCSELNEHYPNKFKIVSFCFEMAAEDEIIRSYTNKYNKSYSDLLSVYKKLDGSDFELIQNTSNELNNNKCCYIEETGTISEIEATIDILHEMCPDTKFIIMLDHTLLAEYDKEMKEHDEVKLVAGLYKMAIRVKKKYGDMIIFLGQLNSEIEKADRRNENNVGLHFPSKGDLFSSKQSFHDSDQVLVINMPERYNLKTYGPDYIPTEDLFVIHILKDRLFGNSGYICFKQDFANGNLIYQPSPNDMKITDAHKEYASIDNKIPF